MRIRLEEGDELYVHKARNVTSAGLFVDAPVPLATGTRVQIELRAPDDTTFTCAARVTWNTNIAGSGKVPHPGFGVQFEDLGDEQRRAIAELVGA